MLDPNQGNEGGDGGGGGKKHHKHKGHGGDGGGSGGGSGGGGSSGGSGGGTHDNIGYIYSWLVNQGFSPNAAAGITGNIRAESGGSTNTWGDGNTSVGICQWHLERQKALFAFAHSRGADPYNLNLQLDFLMHELHTGYPGLLNMLKNTTNMAQATSQWMTVFERPSDTSSSAIQGRINLAQGVRQQYNPNGNYSPTSGGGGGADGGGGSGGAYSSQSGGGGMGPKDKLSPQEMAERYGWAMSFLKSEPELWHLFQQAVQHEWSPQMFAAKLRDTKWFQHNSETVRKNLLLKETDPATYRDRLQETRASINDIAGQMGSQLSDKQLDRVAENALMFGWSDAQIQNTLADYLKRVKGSFQGEAGSAEDELRAWAHDMGVHISGSYIKNAVTGIATGNTDMNGAKDHLTKMAMSAFPSLRDEIKAGQTVSDLASPYMQSMAGILELNPASIDLFHPMIRQALASKNKDGKPDMKTIWQFEQDLREDPRWLRTNNARDTMMSAGRQVMTDFGMAF